ncbi:MAG: methyltransferase domain-containing protein [Zetaproteobacteria bacterium]|nr:MAG: methyltransferase domain-containing protein [Zetaproteobacteria bacterium]
MRQSVLDRYSGGAKAREEALCCPVEYDRRLLEPLPQEIIERDYGCGDPSRYVRPGDVVLDLGSGGGKICYMAAQLVGEEGAVIGVDMNDDMLALARKYQREMAEKLGGDRVRFLKGLIQDLALDLAATDRWLAEHPITSHRGLAALHAFQREQRATAPLIADGTIDLVISNCVLNLVDHHEKPRLFREIFRVLRPGGRVAISDIVADRPVPQALMEDPELWSGCISGAMEEQAFLDAFSAAGLCGVRIDKREPTPWREVEGIAFRAITVTAEKPSAAATEEQMRRVIYRGPFARVTDERGGCFVRGAATPVDAAGWALLQSAPYRDHFLPADPTEEEAEAPSSGCRPGGGCC